MTECQAAVRSDSEKRSELAQRRGSEKRSELKLPSDPAKASHDKQASLAAPYGRTVQQAMAPADAWPASVKTTPRLWCIGGTDPSGMAGLAADQATAQDLASALALSEPVGLVASCLTAQNQTQVLQVQPVSAAFLLSQLDSLDARLPDVIKIGLLPDQATLEALATRLGSYKQQKPQLWLIWDPVLAASNGAVLSSITDPRPLLALVDVLTPNCMELQALAAMVTRYQASEEDLLTTDAPSIEQHAASDALSSDDTTNESLPHSAVAQLLAAGVSAIWCKDGHGKAPDVVCERLYLRSAKDIKQLPHRFDSPTDNAAIYDGAADHVTTRAWTDATLTVLASCQTAPGYSAQNAHGIAPVLTLRQPRQAAVLRGTGCSFATALGCFLLAPRLLPDALLLASAYLQQAFRAASQSIEPEITTSAVALADASVAASLANTAARATHSAAPSPTPPIAQRLPRLGMAQLTNCHFEVQCDRALIELGLPANVTAHSWELEGLPQPTDANRALRFAPLTRPIGIYPIAGSLAQLEQLAMAGVSTLQLRLKQPASAHELRLQLQAAIALGNTKQLQLFINDHWQLALELGAFGVHLGQADLAAADLRHIAAAGLRLGVSTHGELELYQALQLRPSYVALGHVFDTPTKQMPSIAQGLERITQQAQWCQAAQLATVAIGGLDARHIEAVKAAGVSGMAVVRAMADQPTKACQHLQRLWEEA